MAITKIADVIVPELFTPYVIKRTMEQSALISSGIVVNNSEFDRLASGAARTQNMPFFEDLNGDSEAILEDTKIMADKIASNKDVSAIIMRQKMWGASNLSAALAGTDPMRAIGDLVASYWARDMQKELIAILNGVFGSYTEDEKTVTPMLDHIADLTKNSTAGAKNISASAFIDALQLLGDAQEQLTAVAMHSATKAYLKKLNLIETERDSTDVEFETYQGRRVIVDDGCPVDNGTYTTYIFGPGAIALGNGSPVGLVSTETDRDKQTGAGIDYLINRKAFILHPRGIAWTDKVRSRQETPLRVELSNAKNWNPVYEPKQLRIVAMKHKLG